jgi:AraC-like DNA-binding protein
LRFIEERLTDPSLSADEIAAAHHISTRYLRKLFESQGMTVSGWMRQRRLENCREQLTDPALAHLPVSSVAARWGLLPAARFSRLFKDAYGQTPRDYRRTHPSGSAGPASPHNGERTSSGRLRDKANA